MSKRKDEKAIIGIADTNKNVDTAKDGSSIAARILGNKLPDTAQDERETDMQRTPYKYNEKEARTYMNQAVVPGDTARGITSKSNVIRVVPYCTICGFYRHWPPITAAFPISSEPSGMSCIAKQTTYLCHSRCIYPGILNGEEGINVTSQQQLVLNVPVLVLFTFITIYAIDGYRCIPYWLTLHETDPMPLYDTDIRVMRRWNIAGEDHNGGLGQMGTDEQF
ncbi:hypothetical protein DFS33DRAFT_1278111 [Desarmillaria ectypa]|nr:hypothetical protein DFS33DRAFT_1278111 [Desarmillaria ectypa]